MDLLYLDVLRELDVASPEEAMLAAKKALHDAEVAYQKADAVLSNTLCVLRKARNNYYLCQELVK